MKVHWTVTAERHLDAIYHYIAQDSPAYAKRMVEGLYRSWLRIRVLARAIGSTVPGYGFARESLLP